MSGESGAWLQYARENLKVDEMTLQAGLLNPCLQNAQQAVEKALKAIRGRRGLALKRTHSIRDLNRDLVASGVTTGLGEDDCDLFDSIYVRSKYPLDSVLPDSPPDVSTCEHCVKRAAQVLAMAEGLLEG